MKKIKEKNIHRKINPGKIKLKKIDPEMVRKKLGAEFEESVQKQQEILTNAFKIPDGFYDRRFTI